MLAIAKVRSLPMRRATHAPRRGGEQRGGDERDEQQLTAASECSTHVATYCAPASMSPVASACSTNVDSSARNGAAAPEGRMPAA